MTKGQSDVTGLLAHWSGGQRDVEEELFRLVLAELRKLARAHLRRERASHTLQATALVNEAYIRLVDQDRMEWQGRAHFFAIASRMMRRILVDHARRHRAARRGGGVRNVTLIEPIARASSREVDLIALDDALAALSEIDPEQSRLVELRYFGGLTIDETAEVLGVSSATVKRQWRATRAWLYREISRK